MGNYVCQHLFGFYLDLFKRSFYVVPNNHNIFTCSKHLKQIYIYISLVVFLMVIVGKYTSFLWMVFLLFHLSMGSIKLYTVSLPANLP